MVASTAESQQTRGDHMKKVKTGRGFWEWMCGGGFGSTGGNG